MLVIDPNLANDNMPLLAFDPDNPPIEIEFMTDEVLRAEFPYQVMLEAHFCTGKALHDKRRFCDIVAPSLCNKIGAVRTDDVLYRIFSFREPRHARYFHGRFGGIRYAMGRIVTAD